MMVYDGLWWFMMVYDHFSIFLRTILFFFGPFLDTTIWPEMKRFRRFSSKAALWDCSDNDQTWSKNSEVRDTIKNGLWKAMKMYETKLFDIENGHIMETCPDFIVLLVSRPRTTLDLAPLLAPPSSTCSSWSDCIDLSIKCSSAWF